MGTKQDLRYGRFFLKRGRNKEGLWEICAYNPNKRQTEKCASTDTSDLDAAILALKKFVLKQGAIGEAKDLPVLEALNIYYLKYANKLASHTNVLDAMRNVREIFADVVTGQVNLMVSQMELESQQKYIDVLREKMEPGKNEDGDEIMVRSISDATIIRRLSCIWAAFNYCKEYKHLISFPAKINRKRWRPSITSRERLLTLEEVGSLFNGAANNEHQWRSLILFMATGGRSAAIGDLTHKQYRVATKVLDLNPPGRQQTSKHRPVVPVADCVASMIESWGQGYFIQYRGERVAANGSEFFTRFVSRIDPTIIPYHLRHFVSTWLVTRVSPFEKDMFMGHAKPKEGSETGGNYNKYDPHRTHRGAARAIQELFEALAPHVTARPLLPTKAAPAPAVSMPIAMSSFAIPAAAWQVRDKSVEIVVGNYSVRMDASV